MKRVNLIESHYTVLNKKYKELIEQAYNFRQTDSALSDFLEFKAIQILDKLNKLKYLSRNAIMHA